MNSRIKEYKNVIDKGFTLVELLVVISIIAMLLALLMPSLSKARKKTGQIICLTQLKQIGLAMTVYANDNRDLFPGPSVLGGSCYRAAPGYKNPTDPRGLPEKFGLAGVLGKSDVWGKSPKSAYIDGHSKLWVCPIGGNTKIPISPTYNPTMAQLGNSYAFSIAGMLDYTKIYDLKKRAGTNWLVWDNYYLKPYTPGWKSGGSESGYTIDEDKRVFPHVWDHKKKATGVDKTRGFNILYFDLTADIGYNQRKTSSSE
jgi:prepilin-type N-terminal cleavage/methylation domain-containing protein